MPKHKGTSFKKKLQFLRTKTRFHKKNTYFNLLVIQWPFCATLVIAYSKPIKKSQFTYKTRNIKKIYIFFYEIFFVFLKSWYAAIFLYFEFHYGCVMKEKNVGFYPRHMAVFGLEFVDFNYYYFFSFSECHSEKVTAIIIHGTYKFHSFWVIFWWNFFWFSSL